MIGEDEIPCGFNPAVPARLTPALLRAAADFVETHSPDAVLVKNTAGNLAIVAPDDEFLGWIDLRLGEVSYRDGPTLEGAS